MKTNLIDCTLRDGGYYNNWQFSRAEIQNYINDTLDGARQNKYVKTIFGRRRPIWDVDSDNGIKKKAAERVAINMPIQGSAAEIMRLAMIKLDKRLSDKKYSNSKMLLQIHDELIFEVHKDEVSKMIKIIEEEMKSVADNDFHSFSIPLTVDINSGENWGELH